MRIQSRIATISLLLPLVVVGCTGSDTIEPGNGQLTAELVLDPVAGPRDGSKPPFVYARADVAAVTFSAYDPARQISLGPYPLQVIQQTVDGDLTVASSQALGSIRITNGTYRIEKIFITKFKLNTSNEPPIANSPRCSDGALEWAEFGFPGSIPPEERGIVPVNQPLFEIRGDSPKRIRFTFNGPALTAILESHVTCLADSNGATVTPLTASELSSLVTVELQ